MWSPVSRMRWHSCGPEPTTHIGLMLFPVVKSNVRTPVFRLPGIAPGLNMGQLIPEVMGLVDAILTGDAPVVCGTGLKLSLRCAARSAVGQCVVRDVRQKAEVFGSETAAKLVESTSLSGLVSVWKEAIVRMMNLEVLLVELCSSTGESFMGSFERSLKEGFCRGGCDFDRIVDVIVKEEHDDLDSVMDSLIQLLNVLGSYKRRFEEKYVECACERAMEMLGRSPMCLREFLEHARQVTNTESSCVLLGVEAQGMMRKKLAQYFLNCNGATIRSELPNVLIGCEQQLFREILAHYRDADRVEELLDQVSATVEDCISNALENDHVISSLWQIVVEIRRICADVLSFTELRKIQTVFEKKLNTNSQLAARIIAYDIDEAITSESAFDAVAASKIVALLTNRTAFEKTHCYLLIQRLMKGQSYFERDHELVLAMERVVGYEATVVYREILSSAKKTQVAMSTYESRGSIPIRVLMIQSVSSIPRSTSLAGLRFGSGIDRDLDSILTHLKTQMRERRLEWNYEMTAVCLSCGTLRVKCPAPFAAIILKLQSGKETLKRLANSLGVSSQALEPYIHTLTAPQCMGIVTGKRDVYSLNHIAGLVEIPVMINQSNDSDRCILNEITTKQLQENQLDCAITAVLKSARTILASDLSTHVEAKLQYQPDPSMLEARVKSLERRYLIRRDGPTLSYLP